jgi:hypothetical protein
MTDLIVLPGIILTVTLWNSINTLKQFTVNGFDPDIEKTIYQPLILLSVLLICALFTCPSFNWS